MYFNMKHNKQKQIRAVFCCLNSTDMMEGDHQMQVHGVFSTKEKYIRALQQSARKQLYQ